MAHYYFTKKTTWIEHFVTDDITLDGRLSGWMALNAKEEKLRIFQNTNCVSDTVRLKPLRYVVADIAM